ncbi:MAG: hypothetical protein RL684_703 [Pseudomonadota bacterium]|jgi:DNA (cytosine-5)-methyltransferase 1
MNFLSLFSGIEAASEAWVPLGWTCVGVAEIEPFPKELLRQRHPNVPNLGDITKITEAQIAMLGHVDLVVFGSPCQDLSVAGKRKGLAGARSGLFHDALRIVGWLRTWCNLRYALWENVPGAFTSNEGADFAAVVDALAGLEPGTTEVPPKKWGNEGAAIGPEAMVEWSTLDAQWFGVAQRRRRVFALADFGDWTDRPPILLEPESLRGDSAPSRGTREDVAGTLEACAGRSRGAGTPVAGLVPERGSVLTAAVTATLDANYGRLQGCSGQDANHGHSHLVVQAFGGNNQSGAIDVATALNASGTASGRLDFESETFVVGSILAFNSNAQPDQQVFDPHVTAPLTGSQCSAVAIGCDTYNGRMTGDVAQCLGTGHSPVTAGGPSVIDQMRVRRLTPTECERLQAFRDGHTAIRVGKKQKPIADGPRYKALGNSMCVNVMHWIGQRLDFVWRFYS